MTRRVAPVLTPILLAIATMGVSACSDDAPTMPTSPTPTVGSVSIVPGTDWLTLGSETPFSAFVTMTSGVGQTMGASWQSSNASIAEVSGRGVVRAMAPGRATITASASGASATRAIRVAPDFTGTWSGRAVVVSCVNVVGTGCTEAPGMANNLGAVLSQSRELVSGMMQVRAIAVGVDGSLAESGSVTLNGTSEDRTSTGVDHRRTWKDLALTPDGSGAKFTGRGALDSEWLNRDQSVRQRIVVTYDVAADRATSLPTPTVR